MLLGALVFVLGVQSMRFLFTSVAWYVRESLGVPTLGLVAIVLAPFLAGAALPVLSGRVGLRAAMWTGVLLLASGRLLNQTTDHPAVDLATVGVAVAGFVGTLPLLPTIGRRALVGGVLLGLAFDGALRGIRPSLDLAFQPGSGAVVVVAALAAACPVALYLVGAPRRAGVGWRSGVPLLGLGPFLFVQLLVLQSQGWTSAAGGVPASQALLRIALLDVAAVYLAFRFERSRPVLAGSALLVGAALAAAEAPAPVFNVLSILAIPASGPLWAAMVPDPHREELRASAVYLVGGVVLLLVTGLGYYLPLDVPLGFTQAQGRIGSAVLLVVLGLVGASDRGSRRPGLDRTAPALAVLAVLLPLVGFIGLSTTPVRPSAGGGPTFRVMTYNVHSAFDTSGRMDIEAIARVIEDSGADVVGLQEVSRGQLMNGWADLLALLQDRLGFEHAAFFGTTEPVWGNAILSRFPLGEVETAHLPTEGTLVRRGYLAAPVLVGEMEVLFISTHLQHVNDPSVHQVDPEADLLPVHRAQIAVILDRWGGRTPAVLAGDLNARPGWAQIEELLAAGWVDAWEEAGVGPGYTSHAADPRHRIDWILHTPDLVAAEAFVIRSQASDHLPVVADLARRSG